MIHFFPPELSSSFDENVNKMNVFGLKPAIFKKVN